MELRGACIFGQSGGPTSVINASAYGVFKAALESENITRVYGAAHGIKGVLNDVLYDIDKENPDELALLKSTPSSALGSCRYKLKNPDEDERDYARILEVFKKYDIRYFFYNGGNDSMDTCNKISKYLLSKNYDCRVIGVPKTIDNDLCGTDHCPGYGSAAKYIAASIAEIRQDAYVYDTGAVTVVECMGRNAGWLTAAAALPSAIGQGPDLLYLPEMPFDLDKCISDVQRVWEAQGNCLLAISEGVHNASGKYLAEYGSDVSSDAFGHKQMGGAAAYLAAEIKRRMGVKTRAIEFSLLQRCAAHLASATDVNEAEMLGAEAVRAALRGETDVMMGLVRQSDAPYCVEIKPMPLTQAANAEHKFPVEWINSEGTGVTDAFLRYAMPLIAGEPEYHWENGLPRFAHLKKIKAK